MKKIGGNLCKSVGKTLSLEPPLPLLRKEGSSELLENHFIMHYKLCIKIMHYALLIMH